MSHFIRNGNTFKVVDQRSLDIQDKLPAGNYTVGEDLNGNLFLETIDGFSLPSKLYGDATKNGDRILNTFMSRSSSTGVLLTGEKGSGKTLLAKSMILKAAAIGIPSIIINSPWHGDKFNKLLQDIVQPCIVLFDEFEKVYDNEEQESMLTLLDGVYPSKKLFILTCNDKWRIDSHMRNRPGRIFYYLDFAGLTHEFVMEYCRDNLDNAEHIAGVGVVASYFSNFNFDMLKSLVEEMNRYKETAKDAMLLLNAKPEFDSNVKYIAKLQLVGGEVFEGDSLYEPEYMVNPMVKEQYRVSYEVIAPKVSSDDSIDRLVEVEQEEESDTAEVLMFYQRNLKKVDPVKGTFLFIDADGNKFTLTRAVEGKQFYTEYNDAV